MSAGAVVVGYVGARLENISKFVTFYRHQSTQDHDNMRANIFQFSEIKRGTTVLL